MRHWSLLGIRNLRSSAGRTAGATLAIALGVAIVVWVTSAYQSVHDTIEDQVVSWVGSSQISVEPPALRAIQQKYVDRIRVLDETQVVAPRLKSMCLVIRPGRATEDRAPSTGFMYADLIGIDPDVDYQLHTFRTAQGQLSDTADPHYGRLLRSGDQDGCMLEDGLAQMYNLNIGDTVEIANRTGGPITRLTIVGRFVLRRMSKFQRSTIVANLPAVQACKRKPGQISIIDITLHDGSVAGIAAAAGRIEQVVKRKNYVVHTAEARIRQLDTARDQTEFILMLISAVALLTSLFIVATTMSMSMVERMTQLGVLRCLGVTRGQLLMMTLVEVLPVGLVGTAAGVPIGLGMTELSVSMIPEYIQEMVVSRWGLRLAVIGGLAISILSGFIPALQTINVSPLAATRPLSGRPRFKAALIAALLGVLLISAHQLGVHLTPSAYFFHKLVVAGGAFTIYAGYALLTPLLAYVGSELFSHVAAAVLRLRRRLLHRQIASTPWRSGTICSGFMVALSLVVCVSVHSESVMAGWNFPAQIPESFVWMRQPLPMADYDRLQDHEGIQDVTAMTNFMCYVQSTKRRGAALVRFPFSTFVAIEPARFIELTKMEFLEGDEEDAKQKMIRGGYILVPQEGAMQMGLSLGDRVGIAMGNKVHTFEVAGVVKSPSLDIAAQYFQADSQLMTAAGSSVLGTLSDVQEHFEVRELTLLLANLSLDKHQGPVPAIFESKQFPERFTARQVADVVRDWGAQLPLQETLVQELRPAVAQWVAEYDAWKQGARRGRFPPSPAGLNTLTAALRMARFNWHELSPQQRFERFREHLILQHIKETIGRPNAFGGSVRQLKEDIDRDIRRALLVITTIPIVGLVIAAIGAGNLMMANVVVRIRQIAVVRAVGASQWQVIRLVLAEALILGILGTTAGFVLGIHAARNINQVTFKVWGLQPEWTLPWQFVGLSMLLTIAVCIIAGVIPARYAARSNIIAALAAR